jgi:hypothetical protein
MGIATTFLSLVTSGKAMRAQAEVSQAVSASILPATLSDAW